MNEFLSILFVVVKYGVWIIALAVMVGAFALDRK